MSDRIEKLAKEYAERHATEVSRAADELGLSLPGLVEKVREVTASAFRAGAAAGAAESGTKRSEPEWHEPIIAKEQTRD